MTTQHAISFGHIPAALSVGTWLVTGMLVGAFQFLTLRWCVGMFAAMRPLLVPLAIQLVRFVSIAVILAVITRSFGALPLLAVASGILIMRTIFVRLGEPS